MTFYHYYQGDWAKGKKLLKVIEAYSLTEADQLFEQMTGISVVKAKDVTVTLKPLNL